jgi:broad specificity phosphatase PhoE
MNPTTILLVRHGHVHNPQAVLYGRLPRFRLSARGREEARAAGRAAAGMNLAAIYASPLLRARQTAREIRAFFPRLPVRPAPDLNEVFTAYEGRPGAEVDALGGDVYTGVGPPYEQPRDVADRVWRFFQYARMRHGGEIVAAVTHGDPIVFAVLRACGIAPAPRQKRRLEALGIAGGYPATASMTAFTFRTFEVREMPEVRHLAP